MLDALNTWSGWPGCPQEIATAVEDARPRFAVLADLRQMIMEARAAGELLVLQPGESRTYELEVGVVEGAAVDELSLGGLAVDG